MIVFKSMVKPQRVVNRGLLDSFHCKPCIVCGSIPSDPCHVKSRGAGGDDASWNVYPSCRRCHSAAHQMGIVTFARKNWSLFEWLLLSGWELTGGKFIHPRELHP